MKLSKGEWVLVGLAALWLASRGNQVTLASAGLNPYAFNYAPQAEPTNGNFTESMWNGANGTPIAAVSPVAAPLVNWLPVSQYGASVPVGSFQ